MHYAVQNLLWAYYFQREKIFHSKEVSMCRAVYQSTSDTLGLTCYWFHTTSQGSLETYLTETVYHLFLPRDAMLARYVLSSCVCLSVRPSVCPSVWLIDCCRVGQQSAFTRQWNLPPLSCVHPSRRDMNTCFKTPLFDVEPIGPYTNECHIALEVCLSVRLSVCPVRFLLVGRRSCVRITNVRGEHHCGMMGSEIDPGSGYGLRKKKF